MEWFLKVVRDNYANFKGRARRKEYWMFTLISIIIQALLTAIDRALDLDYEYGSGGALEGIYSLAIFLPSLAVLARRLHDSGKSGWNFFWVFTGIGAFYVLYLLIREGDSGTNEYGFDPKNEENQDPFGNQNSTNNPFSGDNNPFRNQEDNNPFRNNS